MIENQTLIRLKNVTKSYGDHDVLKDISLSVKKGDAIGILGNNGAGKTTLLKIITGILKETKGTIERHGVIHNLSQLDAGFEPDLSGRDNIFLNGLLVGLTTEEIKGKIEKIIRFSGSEKYIDKPFYTYSSGMKFRLAFSIAIEGLCDILILDEIFVAGDFSFQKQVIKKLSEIKENRQSTALIMTSHIPTLIWSLSDKFYNLEKGKLSKLPREKMKSKLIEYDELWRKEFGITNL